MRKVHMIHFIGLAVGIGSTAKKKKKKSVSIVLDKNITMISVK
mgnify:CR=1 FL=1